MIPVILGALGISCLTGLLAAAAGKGRRAGEWLGSWGAAASNLIGLCATIYALVGGTESPLVISWSPVIGASFSIGIDPLTGFFLLPIFGLSFASSVFGGGYLASYRGRKNIGASWLFFNLLTTSMALVVMARNAVLFLVAWEIMSLSSWFLVCFDDEKAETRRAGITYLIASQIGTAFLLVLFLLLGQNGGMYGAGGAALDFQRFSGVSGAAAAAAFLLALVGFGTKAGIVPLHVWLPEAHPAAPSHVSAVMSGVMIKTGIYGILRVLTFLGAPAPWWGWTLVVVGAVSGVLGVLFALAQHDLKRLLAYHSVENIGIIFLGLGIGLLGMSYGIPAVAVLGFAGGLLHVLNHAAFKGLLFLGAGSIAHATGTRDLEHLGGLSKRMPFTAAAFLIGSAAICGLPPLNGFVSEILIYIGAFRSVGSSVAAQAVAGGIVMAGLALIGGLAAACFAKAFGVSFLGEPRSPDAEHAHEAGPRMLIPVFLLAACCIAIGLLGPLAVSLSIPAISQVTGGTSFEAWTLLAPTLDTLGRIVIAAGVLAAIVAALSGLRALLLLRRRRDAAGTWDCGYVKPDARMQYTASSFAQPLLSMFQGILGTKRLGNDPLGPFPEQARLSTETPDVFESRLIRPAFMVIGRLLARLHPFQHGRLQLYVLYIAAALLILLVWRLGFQ
jgi:formate hydrogenlyase subunit 3/multisubunit Na+/H+ antiporter MnhD subunit